MDAWVRVFAWMCVFISLGYTPGSGFLGRMLTVFTLWRDCQVVFQSSYTIHHSLQQSVNSHTPNRGIYSYREIKRTEFLGFKKYLHCDLK